MTRSRKFPAAGPEPHDTAAQQGSRGGGSNLSGQPKALHQSILDNTPGALLLTGEQGELLFASRGVEEVFGLTRERVLALDSVEELLGPDLFDPSELDAKGELTGLRYTSRLPSDAPRDILTTVKKVAIGNGTRLYSCCEISAEHCQIQSHGQDLERMATIFDNLLAGIAVCDNQGRFIQANPACEAIFGYSQQEILGRTLADFIFDEDRQRYLGKMQEILTGAGSTSPYRVERRFKTKAGKSVWLDMSVSAVTDDNGHVRNLIAVFVDVTERHLAEEQLLATKDQLDTVLKAIPLPLFAKDRKGRYTLVNPAFCSFFGCRPKDLLGKTVHRAWPSSDAAVYHRRDLDLMEQDGVQIYEHSLKDKNGQTRDIVFTKACQHDAAGRVDGIVGTLTDITEHSRAEKRLRDREQHYRSLFENTGTATLLLDGNKTITRCNAEFEKLSGYSRQEIEGHMKWSDFVHPVDLERMNVYHDRRLAEETSVPREYDFTFVPKNGIPKTVHLIVGLIPGTTDRLASLLDMTARNQVEEQLRWELEVNAALTRLYAPLAAQNATLENMSDTVVDMARRITKSGQGLVVCFDPVSGRTRVAAAGPDVQVPGSVRDADWMSGLGFQDASGPDNDTTAHIDLRQPFYANSLAPEQIGCLHFLNHEPRRLLYVPVLLGPELAGQIVLLDKATEYSDQDLEAVRRMGEFYALSLQRMRFREALMESEEKMRLIIESSPIGIRITQQER